MIRLPLLSFILCLGQFCSSQDLLLYSEDDYSGWAETVVEIKVLQDFKVLALVHSSNGNQRIKLGRYRTSGSFDTDFGENGYFLLSSTSVPSDLVIDNNDNALISSNSSLFRVTHDGILDSSYGTDGEMNLQSTVSLDTLEILELEILDDNSIIAFSKFQDQGISKMALFKIFENGELDSAFANNGVHVFDYEINLELGRDLFRSKSGRIFVASWNVLENDELVFKTYMINPDGQLNLSYGDNGSTTIDTFPEETFMTRLGVQSNDHLIVGLEFRLGPSARLGAIRYDLSGTRDLNFGDNGLTYISTYAITINPRPDLVINNEDKIILGATIGISDSDILLARLTADGQLDTNFTWNGVHREDIKNKQLINRIALNHLQSVWCFGEASIGNATIDREMFKAKITSACDSTMTVYYDQDNDGLGAQFSSIVTCFGTVPMGFVANNDDCNDDCATCGPMAIEVCNGIDDNCNGEIDEGFNPMIFYVDNDQDGYGEDPEIWSCDDLSLSGYSTNNLDCNDDDPNINPDAVEICDYIDNDCNGEIDDGLDFNIYYYDWDGDGYGHPEIYQEVCLQPLNYVLVSGDCDDFDSTINPGAIEICDDIDNNCDGQNNEGLLQVYYMDNDLDGFGGLDSMEFCMIVNGYVDNNDDCDDNDPNVNPNVMEVFNNGIDDNCDGEIDELSSSSELNDIRIEFYPNPANDFLILKSDILDSFVIKFYTINGKLISQLEAKERIDVNFLSSGSYIIEFVDYKKNISAKSHLIILK